MAAALLGSDHEVVQQLGGLTLRPHQATAVARLREIIGRYRGGLLADAVGLGKTYVALAIAREYERPLVICPAALRPMWERAMKAATCAYPVVSVESLSRDAKLGPAPDLLVVDEAHHLRNPRTKRYQAVAGAARHSDVLLMSATPLHNSRRDLSALLGLFAGSAVSAWTDDAIARLVVRRDAASAEQYLPELHGPHELSPGSDDDCLDAILAIPPSIPAADEGVAHALSTISLVHLWTSSRAALLASARRRQARAIALRDAIASGHVPTAAELSAWRYAEGALQLAFPLFQDAGDTPDPPRLQHQLDQFIESVGRLIERCLATTDPDLARVQLLRTLRARHEGARCVAFSQYANTVDALGRLMRADRGIAVITAEGGRIASGPIKREEVLCQFEGDAPPASPVDRIDLLLTTDLLSEGIDLRGASIIIHLDLPWNPARLEQRVGRARRLGSPHGAIHVYTFVPPVAAERMIELRRRLTAKIRVANAVVGGAFDPFDEQCAGVSSPIASGESMRKRIRPWLDGGLHGIDQMPAVAAAWGASQGWIAVVVVNALPRMICDLGRGISADPRECLEVIDGIGSAIPVDQSRGQAALRAIHDWLASRRATSGVDDQSSATRAILDRLAQTVARSPRHRRSAIMRTAQRARAMVTAVRGVGAERILTELARSTADDDAWLDSVGMLDARADSATLASADQVVAVILLERLSPEADATPERFGPS